MKLTLSIVYLFASILLFLLGAFGIKNYKNRSMFIYGLLMIAMGINAICYTLQLFVDDLSTMMLFEQLQYVGAAFYPFLIGLFIRRFANEKIIMNRVVLTIVGVLNIATLFVILTNDMHNLYFTNIHTVYREGLPMLAHNYGPWFLLDANLLNIILVYTYIVLIMKIIKSKGKPRTRYIIIFIGVLMPTVTYVLDIYFFDDTLVKIGGISYLLLGLLLMRGLTLYKQLMVSGITYNFIVNSIEDRILIFDKEGYLLELNNAAKKHLISDNFRPGMHIDEEEGLNYYFDMHDGDLITDKEDHYKVKVIESDKIGTRTVMLSEVSELVETRNLLYHQANMDPLTDISNRRYFVHQIMLIREHAYFVIMDIDHFKEINDTKGHIYGDQVLVDFAIEFSEALDGHLICRYGGEEFAALMICDDVETVLSQLNRFRERVTSLGVTVSMGVTEWEPDDFDETFRKADRQLYKAKEHSRNCVHYNDKCACI